jgi:tetratricopeptide (TPR) repeat protein
VRKTYAYLVDCCQAQSKDDEAWQACEEGLRLFPEDVELRFMQAGLLQRRGRHQEAARLYRDLLRTNGDGYLSSRNRGITGSLARQNLALACGDANDLPAAEAEWRALIQEMPAYKPAWRGLADVLLRQQKFDDVSAVARQVNGERGLRGLGLLFEAQIAAARGERDAARERFARAVAEAPDDVDIRESQCRFLFEQGDPAEAEQALRELLHLSPENPSALHNLAAILLQRGECQAAIEAARESLRHRPDAPQTRSLLSAALIQAEKLLAAGVVTESWTNAGSERSPFPK